MNCAMLRSVGRAAVPQLQRATPSLLCTNLPAALLHRRTIGAAYSSLPDRSSEGNSVIVTGAAKGIGKAIALRLAADGYDVCVNDLDANRAACDELSKEIRRMGRKSCTAIADVTKREEVADMVQVSVRELGPLRTMIANAGACQSAGILHMSDQEFQRVFGVNVFGMQNCFSEAAKQLISQGTCRPDRPGKLIAASSIAGFKAVDMLGHYSSSKFAVRGLMQAYAVEMAEHNITANAYAPGIVDTTIWDNMKPNMGKRIGLQADQVLGALVDSLTMLKRVSVPEDVAKLVSFLASSDSDYVTGQTPLIDGGVIPT